MWQSEVSIDVDAPAPVVYGYLADFPRHREWSSGRMSELNQLTPGPAGAGSQFEAAETVPAKTVDARVRWIN